jgi:hypothetical protein
MSSPKLRLVSLLASIWISALFVVGFLPGSVKQKLGTSSKDDAITHVRTIPLRHRTGHVVSFAITGTLLLLLAGDRRSAWAAGWSAFSVGLLIEYVQPIIFGCPFEWWDVGDDGLGFVLAATILFVCRREGAWANSAHECRAVATSF